MRILDIIPGTSVDGPGLRTSIYFAGCEHRCPGCHNPQSWDFDGGTEMSVEEVLDVVVENDFNVTFTGGDPLYRIAEIAPLAREIVARGYTIWLYTGFTFEQVQRLPDIEQLLPYIDTIVDGPFVEALRDTTIPFRGSSNQRIIPIGREIFG